MHLIIVTFNLHDGAVFGTVLAQLRSPLEPLVRKIAHEFIDSNDLTSRLQALFKVRPLTLTHLLTHLCPQTGRSFHDSCESQLQTLTLRRANTDVLFIARPPVLM
jgi:hypothetical protein